jgi:hypothetical protein
MTEATLSYFCGLKGIHDFENIGSPSCHDLASDTEMDDF